LGIEGSEIDKLLWDAAILEQLPSLSKLSTKDKILMKRRKLAIPTKYRKKYIS